MANEFRKNQAVDFTIENDGRLIGHVRVKPNAMLWSPPNAKNTWYGVSLEEFSRFVMQNGRRQRH